MTTEQKDLAMKDASALPAHLAALGKEFEGAGLENVRMGDLLLPRIVLMQALSPEVADTGKYKSGDLVDSLDDTLLAESGKPLKMVVLKHFPSWIRWRPRDEGGGVIEDSQDPNGALAKEFAGYDWKDKEQKKDIVEYHNFAVMLPDVDLGRIYMLGCGKTNHKHGRKLVSRMKMRGPTLPAFAGLYTVKSETEKNKEGQAFKVFSFENAGWCPPEILETVKKAYAAIADRKIKVEVDSTEGEAGQGHAENEI